MKVISLRCSVEQHQKFCKAAIEQNVSLNAWLLNKADGQELDTSKKKRGRSLELSLNTTVGPAVAESSPADQEDATS